MRRYGLRDDRWDRICDLLPGQEGHRGVTAADNRLFVEAVIWKFRSGAPWRDLPERFGDWKNLHRLARRGKVACVRGSAHDPRQIGRRHRPGKPGRALAGAAIVGIKDRRPWRSPGRPW